MFAQALTIFAALCAVSLSASVESAAALKKSDEMRQGRCFLFCSLFPDSWRRQWGGSGVGWRQSGWWGRPAWLSGWRHWHFPTVHGPQGSWWFPRRRVGPSSGGVGWNWGGGGHGWGHEGINPVHGHFYG